MPRLKENQVSLAQAKAEDSRIGVGIANDPDSRELDSQWFAQAKPAIDVLPPSIFTELVAMQKPRGRPKTDTPKAYTAIRIDADVLNVFKSTGKGWQTKINAALRQFIIDHPIR